MYYKNCDLEKIGTDIGLLILKMKKYIVTKGINVKSLCIRFFLFFILFMILKWLQSK